LVTFVLTYGANCKKTKNENEEKKNEKCPSGEKNNQESATKPRPFLSPDPDRKSDLHLTADW